MPGHRAGAHLARHHAGRERVAGHGRQGAGRRRASAATWWWARARWSPPTCRTASSPSGVPARVVRDARPGRRPRVRSSAHPGRHLRRAVRARRPPGHRGGDGGRAAPGRPSGRGAGHAAEPLRPPALGLPRHLAHRRGRDRGRPSRRPGDLASASRRTPSATRSHVCWLNHRMREYYDLWERFTRGLGRKGRLEGGRAPAALPRARPAAAHAQRDAARRAVAHDPGAAAALRRHPERAALPARRPSGPTAPTATATTSSRSRGCTPLKRLDLLVEAAALMKDRSLRVKIAGEGEEEAALRERIARAGPRAAAWSCWARSPTRQLRRPLRALPRRLLRALERGLRLRDAGGVPLGQGRA